MNVTVVLQTHVHIFLILFYFTQNVMAIYTEKSDWRQCVTGYLPV